MNNEHIKSIMEIFLFSLIIISKDMIWRLRLSPRTWKIIFGNHYLKIIGKSELVICLLNFSQSIQLKMFQIYWLVVSQNTVISRSIIIREIVSNACEDYRLYYLDPGSLFSNPRSATFQVYNLEKAIWTL